MKEYEFHELTEPIWWFQTPRHINTLGRWLKEAVEWREREPVILYEGKILFNRLVYLACKKAGIEPKYMTFEEIRKLRGFRAGPIEYLIGMYLSGYSEQRLKELKEALIMIWVKKRISVNYEIVRYTDLNEYLILV